VALILWIPFMAVRNWVDPELRHYASGAHEQGREASPSQARTETLAECLGKGNITPHDANLCRAEAQYGVDSPEYEMAMDQFLYGECVDSATKRARERGYNVQKHVAFMCDNPRLLNDNRLGA
jgi:hypothetical protein